MTVEEAIRTMQSQGFTVQQSPDGSYLVTDTLSAPPEQYAGVSPEELIETASTSASPVPWWDPAWGPFPMKESEYANGAREPDYLVALAVAKWLSSQGEPVDLGQAYQSAIAAANEAAIEAAQSGDSLKVLQASQRLADTRAQYEQWRQSIQPKKEAPSGAFATQAEALAEAGKLGEGYEAVRDPMTGQWYVDLKGEEAPEEPTEQFLGTVSEGGWDIDQYGYTDANGEQVVTRRQPRQPISDPSLSLDEMIANALVNVDFNDPGWAKDADYIRAQSLRNFQKQPTSQERLQMALQIAQSPSDYLTLAALYTGAIARETPAKVGERIAPLAPFLQELAKQFFLDIPGITPGRAKTAEQEPGIVDRMARLRTGAGVGTGEIPPDVARGIQAGTYEPPPLPGAPPHIPTYAETGLPPSLTAAREAGTISPEKVAAIQAYGPGTLPGMETPRGLIPPDVVGGIKAGTYQPPPLPGTNTLRREEDDEGGGPSVSMDELDAYMELTKKRLAASRKKQQAAVPSFQTGGIVPGSLGQSRLIQAEGGEMVLTPQQVQSLLQQSGMFGPVYRPGAQELPSLLTGPKTVTISSLTGLRPRSLQTQRRMSPTQQALYQPMVESFGLPFADWQQEEAMTTGLGQRRQGARWNLPSMAGLR